VIGEKRCRLATYSRENKLYFAFRELGRVVRTIFLLQYVSDLELRQVIQAVARLSPLADKHFNVVGRYHFTVTDSILRGELRPLRIPDAPEELFWAVGA
jgi:hypothetical protein